MDQKAINIMADEVVNSVRSFVSRALVPVAAKAESAVDCVAELEQRVVELERRLAEVEGAKRLRSAG